MVIQRVSHASVEIDKKINGEIGQGILLLLGIGPEDTAQDIDFLVDKISNLRIFVDEQDKMNKSLLDVDGGLLVVPNFTLYSDLSHGRRPFFAGGASFKDANKLFDAFMETANNSPIKNIQQGIFGADMQVSLCNDGPITLTLDTKDLIK